MYGHVSEPSIAIKHAGFALASSTQVWAGIKHTDLGWHQTNRFGLASNTQIWAGIKHTGLGCHQTHLLRLASNTQVCAGIKHAGLGLALNTKSWVGIHATFY